MIVRQMEWKLSIGKGLGKLFKTVASSDIL